MKTREYSIKFSKQNAKKDKADAQEWSRNIAKLANIVSDNPIPLYIDALGTVKHKLEVVNAIQTKGIILRSKVDFLEHGKKKC